MGQLLFYCRFNRLSTPNQQALRCRTRSVAPQAGDLTEAFRAFSGGRLNRRRAHTHEPGHRQHEVIDHRRDDDERDERVEKSP